jgi:acid stress-induced BolA-like protein IbaG/YrbA
MSFEVTKELVKEMLDEDLSLQTLANQFTVKEIWDMIEDKDQIKNDEQLFEALMDVMYATRPQGDF